MIFLRKRIAPLLLALALFVPAVATAADTEKKFIKWVDFTVPATLMKKAIDIDVQTYEDDTRAHISWLDICAYLGAKCGGDFKKSKPQTLNKLLEKLEAGETMDSLACELKHYNYYHEAYSAALGGLVGEYSIETEKDGQRVWSEKYGLRAFHPIARGYDYSHYDDFGNGRSYGYKRKHLGHDMMALTGTPVIAVESGVVEELGWNQYGGWRIGIRSFDTKRYYYYAHLRQNRPYAEGLAKGDTVLAGDVIGYVGRTGYSTRENTNGINQSHLHFGLQLIFDESQKEGNNEIWIDTYEIIKLLSNHRSGVNRNPETKEYTRAVPFRETTPAVSEDCVPTKLPVVMYHSIQKNSSKLGKYTISPKELESDLKWLRGNGYESVTLDELINFSKNTGVLPEKPVLLTFDDGHYDNVHYADPLLKEYGFTAIMFVVGDFIDKSEKEQCQNPNFSYANRETLQKLVSEGVWELGSHTYSLHCNTKKRHGILRAHGESSDDYRCLLQNDFKRINDLIAEVSGNAPKAFAYPYGAQTQEADDVLLGEGIAVTFSCSLGVNELRPGDSLFRLKRILRASGKPLSKIL